MTSRRLPWLKFYPSDWLVDAIAGCSLAAQGLWLRLLFVMHDAIPYGRLAAEGKPIPDEALSRRTGCESVEQFRGLLAELFAAGVPGRGADGIVFSRRMVRDQQARAGWRDRQRRRRSHANVTPDVTPDVTPLSPVESKNLESKNLESRNARARKPRAEVKPRTQTPRAASPEAQTNIKNQSRRLAKEAAAKAEAQAGSGPQDGPPRICATCGRTGSQHLRDERKSPLDHCFKLLERSRVN